MEPELLKKMYRDMLRIRMFEEKVNELVRVGELYGFYHLYIGQEAVAVGVCSTLNKDDYITSTHRGHGHVIAKGMGLPRMMAELMGKATGYNKAKGGSMHLASPEYGILGANGIVGAGMPIATGAAMSARLQKNGRVAVAFFGEDASNEGAFHESLNLASTFRFPCVFVCENNQYSVGTRSADFRNVERISERAKAYGIPGVTVDGNDVIAVYNAASEAVQRARSGEGPTLIECVTYRWGCHHNAEVDTYRPPEEVAAWKEKCPIRHIENMLLGEGVPQAELDEIQSSVTREVDEAVEFGRSQPEPSLESALTDVYA